jgi:uncharacterized membrane protein
MAAYHPQFVHFAIALLVVGVVFRALSLLGRPAFLSAAAFALISLGTMAAVLAANSGTAAHGPVERVPGSRPAVEEHEEWGNRTRTVFVGVFAIEVLGLLFMRSPKRRYVHLASTLVGAIGLGCLYQAGERGGRLVYSYAGGVGIRSGDPEDVGRLLLAGLYQQAQVDRRSGRAEDAASLLAQAARRFPNDPEVQMTAAESLLVDRKDAQGALALLKSVAPPPAANRSLRIRHGLLTADALEAAGQRDGAAAVVQALVTDFPDVARLKQRLNALKTAPPTQPQ